MSTVIAPMYQAPDVIETDLAGEIERDQRIVSEWLYGKSPHTQEAYARDISRFMAFVGKPIRTITLGDVQRYASSLGEYSASSQGRMLASIKSLLSFATKVGYCPFNVGAMIDLPKPDSALSERYLTPEDVQRMILLEPDPRNQVMLRVLYASAARLSELVGLRWKDVQPSGESGQITVRRKGGDIGSILLPSHVYQALEGLRGDAAPDDPVWLSRHGRPLSRRQVQRIVRNAAERAGISKDVSPHWLRHAHVWHADEAGASMFLIARVTGHKSMDTLKRYWHARPNATSASYLMIP
jgi:integrase/recombinase XerD